MSWHKEDEDVVSAMAFAHRKRDINEFSRLLAANPHLLTLPSGQDYWLNLAVIRGWLEFVELLVAKGISVNDNSCGSRPLCSACNSGHVDIVRWLLDHGAMINCQDFGHATCFAINAAAACSPLEVVKLLVERGANIHFSWHGMNALMHAQGRKEIQDYLRSIGVQDLRDTTPPDFAKSHDRVRNFWSKSYGPITPLQWHVPGTPEVVIHHIAPGEKRSQHFLFTVGLSDRRLPSESDPYQCVELQMFLPPDWRLDNESLLSSEWNWPLQWLQRIIADLRAAEKMPATVPLLYCDPPSPLSEHTQMSGWMCVPAPAGGIQFSDCRWVSFFDLYPIYAEEIELIRSGGVDTLMHRLHEHAVPVEVSASRKNVGGPEFAGKNG